MFIRSHRVSSSVRREDGGQILGRLLEEEGSRAQSYMSPPPMAVGARPAGHVTPPLVQRANPSLVFALSASGGVVPARPRDQGVERGESAQGSDAPVATATEGAVCVSPVRPDRSHQ